MTNKRKQDNNNRVSEEKTLNIHSGNPSLFQFA